MKKILIIYLLFFTTTIFSGTGKINIKNIAKNAIILKFETTNKKQFSQTINSQKNADFEVSSNVGAPDIKDMWVKFVPKEQIIINNQQTKGENLDSRVWSKNINIKNNKTTFVEINYNENQNRFERKVIRNNKTEENFGEIKGKSEGAILEFINISGYEIILHIMLDDKTYTWREPIILKNNNRYVISPGKSGGTTNDLAHMTVEFKNEADVKKHNIRPEKRWWRDIIDIKKDKRTSVIINFDKSNNTFTRTIIRDVIKKIKTNSGKKYVGDYKNLPTYPKTNVLNINKKISEIKLNIAKLESEKIGYLTAKKAAKYTLDAAMYSAIGLNDMAKQASQGLLSLIYIKNATISGSIRNILGGKLPKLEIESEILGKEKTFTLDLDFKNPDNSLKNISELADKTIEES